MNGNEWPVPYPIVCIYTGEMCLAILHFYVCNFVNKLPTYLYNSLYSHILSI